MKNKPCCRMCTPAGADFDPRERIRSAIQEHEWAVQAVITENPHDIGFAYTIGFATDERPELIAFGQDPEFLGGLLNGVAVKTAERTTWRKRFQLAVQPKCPVQLRPALDQWRDTHVLLALDHWQPRKFPLWQVRLPRTDGTFSWDGFCCIPPCQPLLDKEEPWLPVEHAAVDRSVASNDIDVLWHRVVGDSGTWQGRWEKLHGVWIAPGTYSLLNVPFLADDVALADVVEVRRDESGRDVIHGVLAPSAYSTLRIDARGSEGPLDEVETVIRQLTEDKDVVFECNHWHLPHWTLGVPTDRLSWAEELLQPLRRDGEAEYTVSRR